MKTRSVPRVTVYSRHTKDCKRKGDSRYVSCDCPKQLTWFADGKLQRKAAGTGDITAAEKMADEQTAYFEACANGETPAQAPEVIREQSARTLSAAIETFLTTTKNNRKTTDKRFRMLEGALKQFSDHCAARGKFNLAEIKTADCLDFSNGLVGHQNTRAKKVQTVSRFFQFCVDLEMLVRNPVTAPCRVQKVALPQTVKALDDAQFSQLLAAVQNVNGQTSDKQRDALRSLVLLMRYSGLAIKDAVSIERSKLTENGDGFWKVELNRAKTGHAVFGVIRVDIAAEVLAGANPTGRYLFTELPLHEFDERAMDNYVSNWNNLFVKLGECADLKDENGEAIRFTSHFLRHSFVAWAIMAGLATSDIAALIGDTEITVANYYSRWLDARQRNLTERMKSALAVAGK